MEHPYCQGIFSRANLSKGDVQGISTTYHPGYRILSPLNLQGKMIKVRREGLYDPYFQYVFVLPKGKNLSIPTMLPFTIGKEDYFSQFWQDNLYLEGVKDMFMLLQFLMIEGRLARGIIIKSPFFRAISA